MNEFFYIPLLFALCLPEMDRFYVGQTFDYSDNMEHFVTDYEEKNYTTIQKKKWSIIISSLILHGYTQNFTFLTLFITFKMGCPFSVKIGVTKDGMHLIIWEIDTKHDHDVNKTSYGHLPRRKEAWWWQKQDMNKYITSTYKTFSSWFHIVIDTNQMHGQKLITYLNYLESNYVTKIRILLMFSDEYTLFLEKRSSFLLIEVLESHTSNIFKSNSGGFLPQISGNWRLT